MGTLDTGLMDISNVYADPSDGRVYETYMVVSVDIALKFVGGDNNVLTVPVNANEVFVLVAFLATIFILYDVSVTNPVNVYVVSTVVIGPIIPYIDDADIS